MPQGSLCQTVLLPDLLFTFHHLLCTGSSAPVAQLDRASDFGSEGRRFEPCRVHQYQQVNALDEVVIKGFCVPIVCQRLKRLNRSRLVRSKGSLGRLRMSTGYDFNYFLEKGCNLKGF